MQIILKNKYGEFIIGRGGHGKIIEIDGLGLPKKETQTVTYAGQAGQTTISLRDMPRTISMSIDFKGNQDNVLRLYKMLYFEVDIIIISGDVRRKCKGVCTNPQDVESIIYHRMYKAAIQFVCDDPYFHDLSETVFDVNRRTDKFPNVLENGSWYVSLPAVATERVNNAGITNKGAIKIYPIIEIYNNSIYTSGSPVGLVVTNHSTGKSITIDRNMKANEKITIDLPHRKIISDIDGSIISFISDDTVLSEFYLDVGTNDIEIINKNTNQDTASIIRYNNNYEAAVI